MNLRDKIIAWPELPSWRTDVREGRQRLVVTNGCFDVLHPGHVTYLEAARNLGDALLVGLTNDAHVRALKGVGRPVNEAADRAAMLAALASVDAVCVFPDRPSLRSASAPPG